MAFESQDVRDARIDVGAVLGAVVRRLPRIVIVTVLLLAAAFVLLMFMPRLYESSASILIEPRSSVLRGTVETSPPSSNDASVVSSQIELLKSRDTLLTVIDKLNLRSVPEFNGTGDGGISPFAVVSRLLGRSSVPVSVDSAALNTLYDRMTVVQERDSRIISVLVRSTDPQLAADIANAVANAHVARRAGLSLSDTAEASGWLGDEIAKLRVSVAKAETAVANFKVDNDLFIGSNNTSLFDQQLSTIATQITAAQERKNTALSRAELIRSMISRGQPIDGVADVRNSAVIQQLSQEKGRLQGEKAQRSATLLNNHPAIRALTAQIAELDNQIALEGRRVADALEAEAQIEAGVEASLQADLVRAKGSASTATQDTVTLDGLQREAKAQRDLLESYLQRYSEAMSRTDSSSAFPDVRVVSLAAPAVSPASPKTQLILMAVAIVALAGQVGLVIFGELISGRAIIPGRIPERPQDELEELPYVEEEAELDQQVETAETETYEGEEPVVAEAPEAQDESIFAPTSEPIIHMIDAASAREAIAEIMSAQPEPVSRDEVDEEAVDEEVEVEENALEVPRAAGHESETPQVLELADLLSDLVLGRTNRLILAAHRLHEDCAVLAEDLVAEALRRGLSVALVDAGSGKVSDELGLTDLTADVARFGDVVHKSTDNRFAEVPWGQTRAIARNSTKPMTLVEALGDIYEVVVVTTGVVGISSNLALFDELEGRLVLVAGDEDEIEDVAETRERLLDAGFERCEIAAAPRVAA